MPHSKPKIASKFYLSLGLSLWLLTIIFVAAPIWPYIYYRLSPQTSETLASTIGNTINTTVIPTKVGIHTNNIDPRIREDDNTFPPPFDPSLPEENGLIIDKIGVRGEIHEGSDWDEILKNGIWHVPDFGTPENNSLPIILAAHRWGYTSWSSSFRALNSFYSLPKLKIGDQIDIVWNQRKYTYEIYASETGEKITDYSANLILYTCDLWNSPIRIFKYAKRVD